MNTDPRKPPGGAERPGSDRTAYVTHPDCSRHDTGWRHPEHQGRLPAVARAVHRDMLDLFHHLLEVEGVPATAEDLRLAHTPAYIARVEARCREAAEARTPRPFQGDVVVSGASWDAALAAVGCVLTAVAQVGPGEARNAFCAVRPPGHGASTDSAGGFAIFNSVAVAALRFVREGERGRVLVVEWASRAGFGTASILRGEPAVRFLTVHRGTEPPLSGGQGVSVRPLPGGAGLPEVLAALRAGLEEVVRDFTPELVLLSLGCDALQGDPLGELSLTPRDFYELTLELRKWTERRCGGRLVSVLEEGYDADRTARAVVQHLRALADLPPHPS